MAVNCFRLIVKINRLLQIEKGIATNGNVLLFNNPSNANDETVFPEPDSPTNP